jgi:hypothetical protein
MYCVLWFLSTDRTRDVESSWLVVPLYICFWGALPLTLLIAPFRWNEWSALGPPQHWIGLVVSTYHVMSVLIVIIAELHAVAP